MLGSGSGGDDSAATATCAAVPAGGRGSSCTQEASSSRDAAALADSDAGCLLCAEMGAIARENLPCLPDSPAPYGDEAKYDEQAVLFDEVAWRPGIPLAKQEKETKMNERQRFARLPADAPKHVAASAMSAIVIRLPPGIGGRGGPALGASFGADASGDDALVIKDIVRGGFLSAWNAKNAGAEVRSGDRILAVNGRQGGAEALRAALAPGPGQREVSEIAVLRRRSPARRARVEPPLPAVPEHAEVCLSEAKEKLRSAGAMHVADAPTRADSKPFDAGDTEPSLEGAERQKGGDVLVCFFGCGRPD